MGVLGAQKNRLIETVYLSTHNICFGREVRENNFPDHTLIWRTDLVEEFVFLILIGYFGKNSII